MRHNRAWRWPLAVAVVLFVADVVFIMLGTWTVNHQKSLRWGNTAGMTFFLLGLTLFVTWVLAPVGPADKRAQVDEWLDSLKKGGDK